MTKLTDYEAEYVVYVYQNGNLGSVKKVLAKGYRDAAEMRTKEWLNPDEIVADGPYNGKMSFSWPHGWTAVVDRV